MNQQANTTSLSVSNTIQSKMYASFSTHSNRIAITYGTQHYTYQEVDIASNQVCQWLIANELSDGKHIALCLQDRSQLIIWMLGILKARSVFIPLDHHHPKGRIQQLLAISDAAVLITDRLGKQRLPLASEALSVLAYEDIDFPSTGLHDALEESGEDKIYIYFTSGSTGTPKAILGKNESLHHFISWEVSTFGLNETSKVSQFISPGFDAFLRDVFPILSVGGTVCIPDFEINDSAQLVHWIAEQGINLIHCVPSFFKLLLTEELNHRSLSSLKHILLSGEKISLKDLRTWYNAVGHQVQLVNLYGATETTMIKTHYLIQPEDVEKGTIPIGKPIAGTQVFLLDEHLRPVGKNNVGEIYIRTKYGTHGYYKNAKLTAERFIKNPYGTEANDVLYKTGDLGRFNATGNLEFLGRKDRQIKIRGIRVEPGEIEQSLLQHEAITEALIKPFQTKGKETFLSAYVIAQQEVEETTIKAYLAQYLPAYLIPAHIVVLPSFPLLPNGKIDINSLPNPQKLIKGEIIKPTNPQQEKLLALWAETLEREASEISIDANFMEVGGNSLRLVFLANKIKQHFQVKIALSDIIANPTIEALTPHLATLKGEAYREITPVADREYYELSSAQKRMYYLYEYNTSSTAYNMTHVIKLKGKVDIQKMNAAFEKLVARHEMLRTNFILKDGQLVQQIVDQIDFKIADIGRVTDANAAILKFRAPFDLSQAPLSRIGLMELATDEYLLVFDNHHIISDATSHRVLIEDFMSIYKGESLPELKIHYKDYAVWQQSPEQQAALEAQKEFWLDVYADDIPVLDLPVDHPRSEVNANAGATFRFQLDADRTAQLVALANEVETTLFVVLHSIYTILLSKLGDEEDIIVGVPLAGRNHIDLENIPGNFVNTLALRSKAEGGLRYLDYLHKLKQNVFTALENQEYPYEDLVDALNLNRDMPLFNAMFDFVNIEQPVIKIPGLELEPYMYEKETTIADLVFYANENEGIIDFKLGYAKELFDRATIERFATYFQNLVTAILADTNTLIKEINMLSAADEELLIKQYNDTESLYDTQGSLLSAFAAQVAAHPDRVAVCYEGVSLSYAELDARSNQLANYLRSQKIAPGNLVGLLLDRSLDMIVGIMGVLKSGAGYVPVDPSLPEQRVSYMLDQSRTSLLIAESAYMERYSAYLPVIPIGDANIWNSSSEAIDLDLTMDDLAYCIFTSGSSGKPKGVMMSHGSVFNLVKGLESTVYANYEQGLRIALLASYAFDASVQQIFGGLLLGHSLYVTDDVSRKDGAALLDFYNKHQIAASDGTPTHLRMLMNSLKGGEKLSHLKGWILAGEYLDKRLVTQFYQVFGTATDIYNFYGPTETCVDSTYFKINPSELSTYNTIPIGKPLPNERVYVTDNYGNLVPRGVKGELCIAGAGLGRCYVGNQELTSERFVSDWVKGEKRVYRTGDKVRWLADGNLEYFGRMDDQVKLRGYRIELDEITNVLKSHAGVEDVAVLLNGENPEDQHLTAYLVPSKQHAYTVAQLFHQDTSELELKAERYELENGVSMYFYNPSEAKVLYTEIFENSTYYKHGIKIPKQATIIDVGANVGTFSIFAMITFESPTIYAFEPVTPTFKLLEKNTALYQGDIKLFNVGIADKEEEAIFDFYPNATTLSGKYAEDYNIREDVERFVTNTHQEDSQKIGANQVEALVADRLVKEKHNCQLKSLSQVIREQNIEHIDLLKIDAENVEMDVINGIDAADWLKIDQVIVEVYDLEGRLAAMKDKLASHGFEVAAFQSGELKGTKFYDLYCIKEKEIVEGRITQDYTTHNWYGTSTLTSSIRASLSAELPDYMIPSEIILVEKMPLTTNGKLDRRALKELRPQHIAKQEEPLNELELKLVEIWAAILKIDAEQIGVNADFFELGGHSLKLVFLANKIKKEFSVAVSLKELMEHSTIRGICTHLLKEENDESDTHVSIPTAAPATYYPLSSAQKRMYFLNQYNTTSTAYNMTQVAWLKGALDQERLNDAFKALVERHESLRTVFSLKDGIPVQEIIEKADFGVTYFEKTSNYAPLIRDFVKPFDLSTGPIFKIGIIPVADDEHVIIIDNHHIISDMITNEVLLSDLIALYSGEKLPDLRLQYKDYAVWQQADAESIQSSQKDYWINVFKDEIPVLELATTYPRPSTRTEQGGLLEIPLSSAKAAQLKELSKTQKVSMYAIFLAFYNILLSKLSNQEDIVVGTPVSGRAHADLEGIAGLFVNTLALRNYPKADLSFNGFLQAVHESTIKGLENQVYPYEELVDALKINRDFNRNPLFDVFFNYVHSNRAKTIENPHFKITPFDLPYTTTKFDLSLNVTESDEGIKLTFSYRKDLYDEETVARFANYFIKITDDVVSNYEIDLARISILSPAERDRILHTFNQTSVAILEKTVLDLFKERVQQSPECVALLTNKEQLSYQELDRRSDQWASYLISKGIAKGSTVGVVMSRSSELVIGMLAIFKLGATYLPIDRNQPDARSLLMLSDCKVSCVLTNLSALSQEIEQNYQVIHVTTLNAYQGDELSVAAPKLSDLAYILYTSGSTGLPKGVLVEHANLTNLVQVQSAYHEVTSDDKILQSSSVQFDPSVKQVWLALTNGSTLVVVDDHTLLDATKFNDFLRSTGTTYLNNTPSFLERMELQADLPLRRVVVGGEACSIALAKHLSSMYQLYNAYGPTEATVTSTIHEVLPESLSEQVTTVPIGTAVGNVQAYILTAQLDVVTIGVIGELYIGGKGVSRGYLNQEELTQSRFIENPYGEGKLYRTGDLAKWTSDGLIQFMGRADDQVKINGVRVELGEIEYQLNAVAGITNAAVLVHQLNGGKHLTAYYIASEKITQEDIHGYLLERLPVNMVPNYYVELDQFPVTTTGKLAKKRLPLPELIANSYVAPSNETEQGLVTIWAEVLNLPPEQIGVNSDFFELGGHSLNGIQIANAISKHFGVTLKLMELFKTRTIKKISEVIEMNKWLEEDKGEDSTRASKETVI